jgi:SnoaL-like domain
VGGFFGGFQDVFDTSHRVTNILVEGEGDWARCQSHCLAWHWRKRPDIDGRPSLHPTDIAIVGGYQDELRRGLDGWLITKRKTLQFGTGVGAGNVDEMIRPILEGSIGRLPEWP